MSETHPDSRLDAEHVSGSGSESQSESDWARSIEWRMAERLPLPAWTAGALFTAILLGTYGVAELIAGPLDPDDVVILGPFTDTHIGYAIAATMAGYALAAGAAIAAGNATDLEDLRSSGALEHLAEPSLGGGRTAGVLGLVAGVAFMSSVDPPAREVILLERWSLDGGLSIVCVMAAFWLATRAAWFTLAELTAVARSAQAVRDLDPLDAERFEPLGRMALRASVLWAGAAALTSLSMVITSGSLAEVAACAFLVAVAVGSFVIPMRGVHENLRATKRSEISRVRQEIRRDRETVAALGPDAGEAAGRLPGLLAFEARMERAREWPFDALTLRRFGIVLLLPLASWLGGALVERIVDSVLD